MSHLGKVYVLDSHHAAYRHASHLNLRYRVSVFSTVVTKSSYQNFPARNSEWKFLKDETKIRLGKDINWRDFYRCHTSHCTRTLFFKDQSSKSSRKRPNSKSRPCRFSKKAIPAILKCANDCVSNDCVSQHKIKRKVTVQIDSSQSAFFVHFLCIFNRFRMNFIKDNSARPVKAASMTKSFLRFRHFAKFS